MKAADRLGNLSQRQQDGLALLLILAASLLLRAWQLDRFPPGLFGDEAVNGLDALDVLAGRPQVFFPANFGREGLHMLLLAPFIQWLGATALALRLPSVIAGTLTCLATYWLGRELFEGTRLRGTLTPLLAALLLATSYWHVHFSRFGIRGVFTPLLATLAFAAFWRGANRPSSRASRAWFLLAGLFLGLGVHFYTASRLAPVFLGGFLLVQWLISLQLAASSYKLQGSHPAFLRRDFWSIVGMFGVAASVFAPLGLYFLRNPGSFAQRARAVSAFNPEISGQIPLARMAEAGAANVLQFFVPGLGDQATFYNLPGRAVFDPLLALLALAGLLICLAATWRGSSPHLFLLLWFPAMLAPTILAVDRFPTLPRALGVLPGIYFLPAVTVSEAMRWISRRIHPAADTGNRLKPVGEAGGAAWLAWGLVMALALWQGALTWRDYFGRWGPAAATFDAFEGDMAATADWLAAHPGQQVFLAADIYRHPSFAYLHEQTPLSEIMSYQNPRVHFFDGRYTMPLPPAGQPATYLFTHNAGPDPLLAQASGWPGFAAWDVVAGPGQPALSIARVAAAGPAGDSAYLPAAAQFDPNLLLIGYQIQPLADDEWVIFLRWQMAAPEPAQPWGLQVQAGLQASGDAQQLTQASAELAYRATEWAPSSEAISWLRLPVPADLPADLQLAVRLINQANGVPLAPSDANAEGWLLLPLPVDQPGAPF